LLAAQGHVELGLVAATLAGTALIIACACVINNYLDREIDAKMERTSWRALAKGTISPWLALPYAALLGLIGFGLLIAYANGLTALLGLIGLFSYVVLYGLSKRRSVHGTLIGSISGSIPPVAGYAAVTDRLDTAALLLFLILTFWQMPHFFAIAIRRAKDYKAAGLPVLPVVRGNQAAKNQIIAYTLAFVIALFGLTLAGYTGWIYTLIAGLPSLYWLWIGLRGFSAKNDELWAKRVFLLSLVVIVALDAGIAFDSFF
jgi:protoheme IX farnesyltransferase